MSKISVVIPLFNVEKYLDETINSVISQTIGFKDNIELILVNDGSTDGTENICKKYEERFPDNVIYVSKDNSGVSETRNVGMKHITGEYVVFLDGDDKWASDAFEKMVGFFEVHSDEIDVVACRSCYFDRKEGFSNPMDYMFSSDRVVDIDEEYQCSQVVTNNAMFKKSAIEDIEFDQRLSMHEDTVFVSQVIVKKGKFGVLRSAIFYYRKRSDNSSLVDGSMEKLSWYYDVPEYCYEKLVEISQTYFGEVIPYFQFMLMSIIKWSIRAPISNKLTQKEKDEYRQKISDILRRIDDKIIMQQKNMNYVYKICALNLKYRTNILRQTSFDGNLFKFRDTAILSVKIKGRLIVEKVGINGNKLSITGNTHFGMFREYVELGMIDKHSKEYYKCHLFHLPRYDVYGIVDGIISEGTGYEIILPLEPERKYSFVLKNKEGKYIYPEVTIQQEGMYCSEGIILNGKDSMVILNDGKFTIKKYSLKNLIKYKIKNK